MSTLPKKGSVFTKKENEKPFCSVGVSSLKERDPCLPRSYPGVQKCQLNKVFVGGELFLCAISRERHEVNLGIS